MSVLDDGPIGGGETGRTTAHLASAVDDRFYKLEKRFGERGARLVAESHAAAIDKIEDTVRELERWTRERFPFAGQLVERWSGQVLEPADGLAYIGASPDLEHVYVATGDSGNGLTHGTIAGMLLPELIRGRRSSWSELYDPKRRVRALGTLIKEAAHSTAPYVDWLRGGDVASFDSIPPDGGALVRQGLRVIAAYRDSAGELHACSATCPHLRGVVQWNAGESTWDCPCHGSRFDPYGRVLNGPASTDLVPIEPELEPDLPEIDNPSPSPISPNVRRV